jgi:hypothetical protein
MKINLLLLGLLLGFTTGLPALSQTAPRVVGVSPASQHIDAGRTTEISVEFDTPIDPATVDAMAFHVFGRWSGVMEGTLGLEDENRRIRFTLAHPFMAGEQVTVNLARTIRGADGAALAHGYAWQFWIAVSAGTITFEQIDDLSTRRSGEGAVRSYGAYAGDYNRDGYSDLLLPNEVANDLRLFLNDGAGGYGAFTVHPIPDGAVPSTNDGADFNRDGWIDFAVGNSNSDEVSVFMGGNGTIVHGENATAGTNVRGLCVLDLDGDGDTDIVTSNGVGQGGGNVALLLNDGAGHFANPQPIETNTGNEAACAVGDANEDGILDVFVGAYGSSEVVLLLGDGEGGLAPADVVDVGSGPWMMASGDVNGDSHVDALVANNNDATFTVVLGDGAGGISDGGSYPVGSLPVAMDVGDLDGDGDLDAVTSNFGGSDFSIYANDGDGTFTARPSLPATAAASCAILHDRDLDGDLDITGIDEVDDRIFLFENRSVGTAVEPLPRQAVLALSVAPNPFRDEARVGFHLEAPAAVRLIVHNILGQHVATAFEGTLPAGEHMLRWNGSGDAGWPAAPGLYLVVVDTGHTRTARQVVRLP